jgi:hypothetical protein
MYATTDYESRPEDAEMNVSQVFSRFCCDVPFKIGLI